MMITMSTTIRTYSELITLPTFEERFEYLKLSGRVGDETFGRDRYLNQLLYQRSDEWKASRREVILRDNGCDLGCEGYEIYGQIIVHHMNPITIDDVMNLDPKVFDPEFLISTMHRTHNAIHYGNADLLITAPIERRKNDTCPWRH